jgi:hypothetical protein
MRNDETLSQCLPTVMRLGGNQFDGLLSSGTDFHQQLLYRTPLTSSGLSDTRNSQVDPPLRCRPACCSIVYVLCTFHPGIRRLFEVKRAQPKLSDIRSFPFFTPKPHLQLCTPSLPSPSLSSPPPRSPRRHRHPPPGPSSPSPLMALPSSQRGRRPCRTPTSLLSRSPPPGRCTSAQARIARALASSSTSRTRRRTNAASRSSHKSSLPWCTRRTHSPSHSWYVVFESHFSCCSGNNRLFRREWQEIPHVARRWCCRTLTPATTSSTARVTPRMRLTSSRSPARHSEDDLNGFRVYVYQASIRVILIIRMVT